MARRLATARALVVTATEEFGIAAVESLAAGRPVIALNAGGVRESVTEGVTGTFYDADDPAALAAAVGRSDALTADPAACRAAAERFGADRFRAEIRRVVDEAVAAGAPAPLLRAPGAPRAHEPAAAHAERAPRCVIRVTPAS